MRRKIPTLIFLGILPFILTACSLGDLPVIGKFFDQTSNQPVTLTMWGLWEDTGVMQALITKYQEEHPNVTIEYEDRSVMELVNYKERVFERAQQSTGPDIVRVHNSWVTPLSVHLAPLPSKLMETDTYSTAFYPVVAESAIVDGKIYGIPLFYDGLVLVYNKEHFEEIEQIGPPTAWEEFRRLALELTVRSGERNDILLRSGAAMGTAENINHFSDILGLMWSQAGVRIPADLDSKAAQDALIFYTNFVREDRVWNKDKPEATKAFVEERVSMIFVPSWQILDIINAAPDLEFGVAPVPQALPDTPVTWGSFWMEVVPANSENPQVAWDFLNFLAQEEQQLFMFSEASKERAFGAPYSLVSLGTEISSSPYIGSLIQTAQYAKSAEIAARAGNKRQVDALKGAVTGILGGGSASGVLKTAKDTISQ